MLYRHTEHPRTHRSSSGQAVSGNAVRLAWERLRKRAGVRGLRFHDLGHEAVRRLFEAELSITEVAPMSGYRDARMLMRHTHLRPEVLAEKLAKVALAPAV
jgi:integrase